MSNIILQHWRHNENVLVDDKLKRSVPSPQFKVPQTYAAGLWLQILNPQPLIPQSPEGGEKHRSADFQRLPFRHGCISADEVKSDGNAVGRWGVKSVRVDGGLCKDLGRRNEENVVDVICTLPLSRKDAPSNPNLDLMVRDDSGRERGSFTALWALEMCWQDGMENKEAKGGESRSPSPINRYISNVVKFVTFQQSFLHFNVENAFTQHFGYIEM